MEVHRPAFCFRELFLRLVRGIGAIGLVLEAVAASGGLEAPLKHLPVKSLPVDNFDVPGALISVASITLL